MAERDTDFLPESLERLLAEAGFAMCLYVAEDCAEPTPADCRGVRAAIEAWAIDYGPKYAAQGSK